MKGVVIASNRAQDQACCAHRLLQINQRGGFAPPNSPESERPALAGAAGLRQAVTAL